MKSLTTATTTLAGVLLLALSGCVGLGARETATVSYLLRPPAVAALAGTAGTPTAGPLARSSLKVVRVFAQPGYGGDRILLLGDDRSLGYFAASRWIDALPAVLGTLAVETLRGSGALRAVHDEAAPFSSDYTLRLTIQRFDAQYPSPGAAPHVTVGFECALGRRTDRTVVASFVVQAEADAADGRMRDVVAAFERATQQALAEAVRRTLDTLAVDAAASASKP